MKKDVEFAPYAVKAYEYWTLFLLARKQWPYVGRAYAWWNENSPGEGERMHPSMLPDQALVELHRTISKDMTRACKALGYTTEPYGKQFLLNMCYLANEESHNHHMHVHFIPRSKHPIVLEQFGVRCEDRQWGHNYATPINNFGPLPTEEAAQWVRRVMSDTIGGIP